ncbi:MAG: flagellar basal body P-ring protein FlgI [Erythrobacter sp.]|uniref:flagellar basal body P-ring protein FlgI n=1 Tax=Erythrobacter sp. TaxID=1042 RepID=UPI0032678E8D
MMKKILICLATIASVLTFAPAPVFAQDVALNGLGRFDGWRDNPLTGLGLVTGLPGTGDRQRNRMARRLLRNTMQDLGVTLTEDEIDTRNVAVVTVTATLPPSANPGDRIDVNVSTLGDARSLAGGTLILTELKGPDGEAYVLAQGPLAVGGYAFDAELERQQRNFPTTAIVPNGGTIEYPVEANILKDNGQLSFLLSDASFTTAERIAQAINRLQGFDLAYVKNADEVVIQYPGDARNLSRFVSQLESLRIVPDRLARIVINERTGTIVAGSNVRISSVVISQGDIKITVKSDNEASQPGFVGGVRNTGVNSLIVTNVDLAVEQGENDTVASFPDTDVGALVQGLAQARVDTRRIISILQAMKTAGALHAEIVTQ